MRGKIALLPAAVLLVLASAPAALAHPHTVVTPNHTQELANAQNHGPFVHGVSCGGDPAAYGLETAHHGPDAGTPGKADGDGCYRTTGGVPPSQDVKSPVIR